MNADFDPDAVLIPHLQSMTSLTALVDGIDCCDYLKVWWCSNRLPHLCELNACLRQESKHKLVIAKVFAVFPRDDPAMRMERD